VRLRVVLVVVAIAAVCASVATGSGGSGRVVLTVSPADVLIDQPVSITVSGLAPREAVAIETSTSDNAGNPWQSTALVRADDSGRVNMARARVLSGSYIGRDRMGLFWSMYELYSGVPKDEQTFDPAPVSRVRFRAVANGRIVASATLVRRTHSPGVSLRRTTLANEGFIGCFWSPARTSRPMPAILRFGGSEGGLNCAHGLLASPRLSRARHRLLRAPWPSAASQPRSARIL
jgi:hypothetical protein